MREKEEQKRGKGWMERRRKRGIDEEEHMGWKNKGGVWRKERR